MSLPHSQSGRLVRIYSLALFRAFHVVRLTLCMLMGIFKISYAYLKSKDISKPLQVPICFINPSE